MLAPDQSREGLARRLFAGATEAGARSLMSSGGTLEPGRTADFFTVDLNDCSVAGAGAESLLSHIVFSLERTAVRDVCVGGRMAIRDGKMKLIPPGSMPINHASEVARAHIAAAERGRSGENYILGGEHAPLVDIFRQMARLMGMELRAPVAPRLLFKGMARVAGEWREVWRVITNSVDTLSGSAQSLPAARSQTARLRAQGGRCCQSTAPLRIVFAAVLAARPASIHGRREAP